MAKHDPPGATDYSADDLRAGHLSPDGADDGMTYPDPFPPLPHDPYRTDEALDSAPVPTPEPAQVPAAPAFFSSHRYDQDDAGNSAPRAGTGFFGAQLGTAPDTDAPDTDDSLPAPSAAPHTDTPDDAPHDDDDPATDPSLPLAAIANRYSRTDPYSASSGRGPEPYGFDPFDPAAFRPEVPWYRTSSAMLALGAIGIAVVALLIAAVLLFAGSWNGKDETGPSTTTTTTTLAPTTTPLTSAPAPPPAPPPPPPPPPPSSAPNNSGGRTYWPQYPRQNQGERNPGTVPQTRGPDVSVRPTHRTAFPGQPGAT